MTPALAMMSGSMAMVSSLPLGEMLLLIAEAGMGFCPSESVKREKLCLISEGLKPAISSPVNSSVMRLVASS